MATSSNPSRVWITAAVIVLSLWGGYLRFEDLSRQSYWMDEGFTVNAIETIRDTGSPTLASGESYDCPLYCYPSAYIADILGDEPSSYRLLAAIAGTVFIPIFFLIVRRMVNTWVALGATALLSLSYISVTWAREARWYTLFELFFWLSLWTFWELMQTSRKDTKRLFLWGAGTLAASALSAYTHELGVLLPLIFLAWAALDRYVIAQAGSWKEAVLTSSFIVIGALIMLLALPVWPAYLERISFYNTFAFYFTYLVATYWPLLLAMIPAIILTSRTDKRALWFLLFTFAVYLVPLALLNPVIHYRYIFHLTPVLFAGAALGIAVLFEHVRDTLSRAAVLVAFFAVCAMSSVAILLPQSFYFLENDEGVWLPGRTYSASTPQPDWNAAYELIRGQRDGGDIVISSLPVMTKIFLGEPGYWLPYSYLGLPSSADDVTDGKESYVGADAIESLDELKRLMTDRSGFVAFDRMAAAKRVDGALISYISANATLIFHDRKGSYSEVWVYSF